MCLALKLANAINTCERDNELVIDVIKTYTDNGHIVDNAQISGMLLFKMSDGSQLKISSEGDKTNLTVVPEESALAFMTHLIKTTPELSEAIPPELKKRIDRLTKD